jgi:virginiamycin B lyase
MRKVHAVVTLIASLLCAGSVSHAATVTGTVKGPDGAPFKGAFVEAQNSATKITVNVLSAPDGRYRIENLPAGEYDLRIRAIGYKADPQPGVKLTSTQKASADFALQAGMVRWSDLSGYQGKQLLPEGKGKQLIERQCFACHMFQSRMAAVKRDQAGWTQAVNFMRTAMHSRLGDVFSDQDADVVIHYLNDTFGVDAHTPKSPSELPGYEKTVRPVADDALNIVYVEYDMPGPNRMPFSAAPDKDGYLWIPDFGPANRIGRLDPRTGKIEEFTVPNKGTASVHSAVPAPDGSVWAAEQASNKVARWDPHTKQITEYQDTYAAGMQGLENGGSKHTVRIDPKGRVWGTAVNAPLTVFDPKTGEFTHFKDVISPYGVEIDKNGNAWFAEFRDGGEIGVAEADSGKVTRYAPPTPGGWPRRIEIAPDGMIWVAEYRGGRIDRFDPQTHAFQEYKLPGPDPTPYALGIDKDGYIWYSSDDMDVMGRLDSKTGQVIEFPYVHAENMMKEFFLDNQGHIWYGSAPNNKVGYFYLTQPTEHAAN